MPWRISKDNKNGGLEMQWELREVNDIDCTMDDSGVYVVIHRVVKTETHKEYSGEKVLVRADLMADSTSRSDLPTDKPIMSWIGTANAVRKHLIAFLHVFRGPHHTNHYPSLEHASYIGYELHRAETDPHYIQD